ncbi:cardiac-enriched FHL2-interacting protein [Lates calcarifer]|uniref:Cardiac-enriched FHL2-interacting protein n=1 Tax=Lates calcarifer TaxID=8187 RepID=A0AAJ7PXD5_LATCA|nr:cardiac-enriched FHL2-interacting protein [Lates calcarifer]XP_018541048.1 cardiac-enriched FHL2-interacting protein [Lates calcarifer]XP_050922257.1 cardiac-enriched FHL2-interacting protein [Lates calcarifer]XP_050922258.1 cardiac-enriched FHL2-interacting protein [Lates calcarifer]
MSCVEKRHMSHRVGSMLHHRFPNGFSDLFMDETDREVSTLTDRAFRSLCVGDDAVYNDEFLYGYSPFSCHKPLAGEPLKKTHHKESKKQGQNKNDKNDAQPWKQQQQNNMSHMSSFLKALSATEESCEGMLIKNGGMTDSNGESWDKSALRSIQRELSEFSSDYHTNLTERHYKNHHSGDGSSNKTGKDLALLSGKSSKIKNGKSTVKLRKLNIKNFFLHSEFSPFQTWRDFNRFPFGQEETVTSILPTDNIPKWYDLPFYKELTEAHRKETLHTEEAQSCQKAVVEPPPPTAPKPIPPPPPPKVLPKPSATPAEKRCSSEGGDGNAAPWRRNRSRAKSTVPVNQPGVPIQDNYAKTVDESLLLVKKEAKSVEVKAIEEVSSLASTPFSICQLMTPLIPSRQPTETSEILQGVLSPSALDLPLRPHSEAKVTPEPPVKRDSYKSLASSILFNLKDNRKRVKSRYSPPKFKTLELPEDSIPSPQSDHLKHPQAGSEGNASGLSTPAILKDGQTVCSPILEPAGSPTVDPTKQDTERPLSDDYLLSNLLQTKREAAGNSGFGEENPISPFIHSKKNKSPMTKKQNYPSLNLYKKASPVDSDMKYLQVPLSTGAPVHIDQPAETNELSPLMLNKEKSPKTLPTTTGLSPNTLNVNKDRSPIISPQATENERLSSNILVGKRPSNVPGKTKQSVKDTKEKDFGLQPASKEKDAGGQTMSTMDVIRAAREAINATKHRALSAAQSESISKPISEIEEMKEREIDDRVAYSKEKFSSNRESLMAENNVLLQSKNETS